MTEPLPETAGETTPERPWPVRHLSIKVKEYIDRMPSVWVEGQVLGLRRWKQVFFLTLRDADSDVSMSSTLPAAEVDALEGGLAEGTRVVVNAKPSWWTKSGTLNLDARTVRRVGIGELLARVEALRERLAAEGLFADDRKVPLPFVPHLVGLICANQGDAEHDVVVNATERWPSVRFEIRRVTVQGAACVPETTAAIRELDAMAEVDVIVVARGGGSLEDLLPFSSEAMVRAAAACVTPLVSAIGHEKDAPLLDLVADLRASTPTDAGKRIVPDAAVERRAVARALDTIRGALEARLDREAETLVGYMTRPVLVHPSRIFEPLDAETRRNRWANARARENLTSGLRSHLNGVRAGLRALSPQSTLDRGYAVVTAGDAGVVRDASAVEVGGGIDIRFARGGATADIRSTRP